MTRPVHFADRLLSACRAKGAPVCVGLDPVLEKLPRELHRLSPADACERFCRDVVDAVADLVPCVKPQAACFERYAGAGFEAMMKVVAHAQRRGLLVIADVKRGDIGVSAAHYAQAFAAADAVTVSPYLGEDALRPFLEIAVERGSGVFVLVRTSNPSGDALQSLRLTDGRTLSDAVADLVTKLGDEHLGVCGFSHVGAVVGATRPADAAALRQRMTRQIFLVPGFGAQGGTARDVKACFHPDGRGAIVTASRSVIYPCETVDREDWAAAVRRAAAQFRDEIAAILDDG